MEIFINGTGSVTPQETFDKSYFYQERQPPEGDYYQIIDPVYKEYISPIRLRRMGKIMKMGVSSAMICLKEAKVEVPDAITMGTGMGCLGDTEKFLTQMLETGEGLLTPTPFIQSTHNAVGAQIALMLKCKGHNYTFVNRGFSFESALLDGMLLLKEQEADNVLVGGVDALTDSYHFVTKKRGYWKNEDNVNADILHSDTIAAYAGEGSVFVLLSHQQSPSSYARLVGVKTIFSPNGDKLPSSAFEQFLGEAGLNSSDIDMVVLGINGDVEKDGAYYSMANDLFSDKSHVFYKHLCGEYHTSCAFALELAAAIIKKQNIPELVRANDIQPEEIKNVLIYNHWNSINHSLTLIARC